MAAKSHSVPQSTPDLSGCNVSVTVNNGSTSNAGRIGGGRQMVTITPLPPGARIVPRGHSSGVVVRPAPTAIQAEPRRPSVSVLQHSGVASKIDKVFLKASYKGKKDVKKFTLRNVDPTLITSSGDLKELIKANLQDDIKSGDFDVGYMVGNEVTRVRTEEDLREMWSDLRKSNSTTLWCDGLIDEESGKASKSSKSSRKRKHVASDDESDGEPSQTTKTQKRKKVESDAKVQEVVDSLKSKHGTKYTVFQLRIWAELISSGLYVSTDEPPCNNSMFQRAGGGSSSKKKQDQGEPHVAQALSEVATTLTQALSRAPAGQAGSTSSPARLIDSRSKLYKQLSELQNLKSAGILTESEYTAEKGTIMDLLTQLKQRK